MDLAAEKQPYQFARLDLILTVENRSKGLKSRVSSGGCRNGSDELSAVATRAACRVPANTEGEGWGFSYHEVQDVKARSVARWRDQARPG